MLLTIFDVLPILLTFAGAFTMIYAWKTRRAKQRKAETEALGRQLNLMAVTDHSLGLTRQLQSFELFERERSSWFRNGSVSNILRGEVDGTQVYLFDYSYVVSTGKSSRRITQTVFFADDKNWYLPDFRLKPETWWHKVLAYIGWESDVNFEESKEFSDKFWLNSEFNELIQQKFTPEIRDFLTEQPPVHLEGSNYYLIAYKPNKMLSTGEAETFFKQCCDLLVLLKKEGKTQLLDLATIKMTAKEKEAVQRKGE
ncbi:MAG: hypothetical protein JNM22_18995 [Saprospiraceae bacterium]|nr:hypothetical protein [Saprospiraceae bacterium]